MKKNSWWICVVPLYAFTLLFVLGPMIYMVAISFASNNPAVTAFTGSLRWTILRKYWIRCIFRVFPSLLSWR